MDVFWKEYYWWMFTKIVDQKVNAVKVMTCLCIVLCIDNVSLKKDRVATENINPLVPSAPFLSSLKTSGNHKVFWCFHGIEKRCTGDEWLKLSQESLTTVIVTLPSRMNSGFSKVISRHERSLCHCFGMHGCSKYSYQEMKPENVPKS